MKIKKLLASALSIVLLLGLLSCTPPPPEKKLISVYIEYTIQEENGGEFKRVIRLRESDKSQEVRVEYDSTKSYSITYKIYNSETDELMFINGNYIYGIEGRTGCKTPGEYSVWCEVRNGPYKNIDTAIKLIIYQKPDTRPKAELKLGPDHYAKEEREEDGKQVFVYDYDGLTHMPLLYHIDEGKDILTHFGSKFCTPRDGTKAFYGEPKEKGIYDVLITSGFTNEAKYQDNTIECVIIIE